MKKKIDKAFTLENTELFQNFRLYNLAVKWAPRAIFLEFTFAILGGGDISMSEKAIESKCSKVSSTEKSGNFTNVYSYVNMG